MTRGFKWDLNTEAGRYQETDEANIPEVMACLMLLLNVLKKEEKGLFLIKSKVYSV